MSNKKRTLERMRELARGLREDNLDEITMSVGAGGYRASVGDDPQAMSTQDSPCGCLRVAAPRLLVPVQVLVYEALLGVLVHLFDLDLTFLASRFSIPRDQISRFH